ncbi:hypothetical protein M8818_005755 [Zalaria obscura]|uniref:Uncharacterized protein n=1 Tax=Zalaria obscura TaxID=2024903 RepID=A0ACC3S9S8_9PEZI
MAKLVPAKSSSTAIDRSRKWELCRLQSERKTPEVAHTYQGHNIDNCCDEVAKPRVVHRGEKIKVRVCADLGFLELGCGHRRNLERDNAPSGCVEGQGSRDSLQSGSVTAVKSAARDLSSSVNLRHHLGFLKL